ncbi:MAG: RNA methyltransferase [Patescibacteria group bacterium]
MRNFYLILDNLRSAFNVGSIFRTADALAVDKIFLCGITPTPEKVNRYFSLKAKREIEKTALGAEKFVPWEYYSKTGSLINKFKKEKIKIIALEQNKNSIPFNKLKINKNDSIALILGNEIKGIKKSILKKSDYIVEIPMFGKKESLNVAIAFAIVGYWLKLNF